MIRPERVRIEQHGTPGPNRVPGMVERLVFLGAGARSATCSAWGLVLQLQALAQNDGLHPEHLAQGTPVHVYLASDALRVLRGSAAAAVQEPDELKVS